MTDTRDALRRATDVMLRGTAAAPDDFDHPSYEAIESLVDGRLVDAEREAIESHIGDCPMCAQDASDLRAVRALLVAATPAVREEWPLRRVAVLVATLAASVLLAIWIRQTTPEVEVLTPAPAQATAVVSSPPAAAAPAAVTAMTTDEQALVARVRREARFDVPPAIAALAGQEGTLLGGGSAGSQDRLALLSPLATGIETTRPLLRWSGVPAAAGYSVQVVDDRFTVVASTDGLTATAWQVPHDLRRGVAYQWQVTAHLASGDITVPAPPQPEARFVVVGDETVTRMADARRRLVDEPLALAAVLAQAGLLDEAGRHLQRAAAIPQDRDLATRLQAALTARR